MKGTYLTPLIIAVGIVCLDQLTKLYISHSLPLHGSIEILEDFLHVVHVRNTGVAFGLLAGQPRSLRFLLLLPISCLAVFMIFYFLRQARNDQKLLRFSLTLLLAGAVGNLIDRMWRGEVVDFIDVHWHTYHWPAFNVADSAITVGVGLLVVEWIRSWKHKTPNT